MRADAVELGGFFPYKLAVASEAFSRQLTEVYRREYGLSREEWRLLFLLANEESVTSLELSRRTTLDKVQVTRAAQKLEDKGLIERSIPDEDRRLRIYQCTAEGRSLFRKVLPEVEARTQQILDCMTPEDRAALERGLAALLAAATES